MRRAASRRTGYPAGYNPPGLTFRFDRVTRLRKLPDPRSCFAGQPVGLMEFHAGRTLRKGSPRESGFGPGSCPKPGHPTTGGIRPVVGKGGNIDCHPTWKLDNQDGIWATPLFRRSHEYPKKCDTITSVTFFPGTRSATTQPLRLKKRDGPSSGSKSSSAPFGPPETSARCRARPLVVAPGGASAARLL
jgi:hypothetical protein